MDYKDILSNFGKGIDKDIASFKQRNDIFLKRFTSGREEEPTHQDSIKKGIKNEGKQGLLLTDIEALSNKCNVKKDVVRKLLENYCTDSKLVGIQWTILDANRDDFGYVFKENDSWEAYRVILRDFMGGMGLEGNPEFSVFIIGGDDIIPMPKIQCPLKGLTDDPLDADFLYCFDPDDESLDSPICNVGRLPLENGKVKDGIELIEEYFNKSLAEYDGNGLDIERGVMTSTESWLPSSREMIRNLPIDVIDPEFDCTDNNMFVSPQLDSANEKTQVKFNNAIGEAGFLMFNLHGSDSVNYASYYGEDMRHSSYPEAFTRDNLFSTTAKIINATACYGGRYVGYDREHSLLLQAIYGPALLYTASCTTALGRGNGFSQAVDILMPAGMSETLMKLYTLYLYSGLNAGLALLKSKIEYFKTCKELDGYNESLATILMFNLYGNPLLNMKPKLQEDKSGTYAAKVNIQFNNSIKSKLITGIDGIMTSTYNEVRERVDSSLADIKESIQNTLYKEYGLSPEDFSEMDTIIVDGEEKGYVLTYSKKVGPVKNKVFAKTDLNGVVQDIIHTK